jgi:cyclophilin family peptidyl-prolyl cis-trans isomerase
MSKRKFRRKVRTSKAASSPPQQPDLAAGPAPGRWAVRWGLAGGLAIGLALWLWLGSGLWEDAAPHPSPPTAEIGTAQRPRAQDSSASEKPLGDESTAKDPGGSFLEAFAAKGGADHDGPGQALSDDDLQQKFQTLLDTKDQFKALVAKVRQTKASQVDLRAALAEKERLLERQNKGLAAFEKELAQARRARPSAAVPAWLSGELLILVGGEPEEILPHLRRALARGLKRPRIYASLARALTEANQLEEAFQAAATALDLAGQDRYAWTTFTRAAFNTERFAEVAGRLDRAFPQTMPDWAQEMHREARAWEARWQVEQKLRRAEQKGDDLPRVRLLIEHRRFARDAKGAPLTTIETTGKGEVIVELFEDQAPAAVANFLTLVTAKTYDGTRFHLAEPAALVAGGDPQSRTGDPADDGTGGPGYFIPDEYELPGARGHFRGSLSLVNNGRPHTSGCQFFLTLVPMHEMDGRFTVFGRVLKGQDVVERITLGRTNPQVGHFGRIIPGDLLVRAEVLRKRRHEYRVIKEPPK